MPAGSTFFKAKTFCFSSNAYLFRLPFGVSITTCRLSFFLLNGDKRDGLSRRLDFALLDKCVSSLCGLLLDISTGTTAVFHRGFDRSHQVQDAVLGDGGINTGSAGDGHNLFHIAQRKENQRHARIEI